MPKVLRGAALLVASMLVVGFASTNAMADSTFNEVLNTINLLPSTGPLGHFTMVRLPVPEADTWAMIGVGVGMVAYQLRRRGKKNHKSDLS